MPNLNSDFTSPPGPLLPHTDGCFPGEFIRSDSLNVLNTKVMPVWTMDRAIYSIVLHLADSIPTTERMQWIELRRQLTEAANAQSRQLSTDEITTLRVAYDQKVEKFLNAGYGDCPLRNPSVAEVVAATLEHDNGKRYALHAWTIMPNHLHAILQLADGGRLNELLTEWKRVSSHAVNRILGRDGQLWMEGAYTRIIRTTEEYRRQLSYLWNNPAAAGLSEGYLQRRYVEWEFI